MQMCHPNAYLRNIRNVKSGLAARSKILFLLDSRGDSASKIARASGLTYGVVTHHLRLLECQGTVERRGSKRFVWLATGYGQTRLS
jgi:DNA-binding transcriptional ArsR family regulator